MGDFRVMFKLENGEYRGKNKLRLRLGLSSRAKDHLKPITHPKLLDLSKRRFLTRFLLSRSPSPSSIELGSSSDKPTKISPPVVGVYHPTTASLATDTPFSSPISPSLPGAIMQVSMESEQHPSDSGSSTRNPLTTGGTCVHSSLATHGPKSASTYSSRGKWNEAEQLEVQVIDMRKKLFGAEHSDALKRHGKSSKHIPSPFSHIRNL